jgi:hypothetical protein
MADAGLSVSDRSSVERVIDDLGIDAQVDKQGRLSR